MTTVINIRTGLRFDVYIGRGHGHGGYFGNPYRLRLGERRGMTLDRYRTYFYDRITTDSEFRERVLALKGKVLGCFCHPQPCHGDIIIEWLNLQP